MKNIKENTDKEKDAKKDDKASAVEDKHEEIASDKTNIKKDHKVFHLTRVKRIFLYAVGAVALLASMAALFIKSRPYEKTEDVKLNSYDIITDSSYKVHLQENNVFEDEFLGEGRLYPNILTDSVSIDFKSEINLIKDVKLSGDYKINAVLEGYQDGNTDEKITVYEKIYPLAEGKIDEHETHNETINESLNIERAVYRDYAQAIESVIGGETAKDFYIWFSGKYNMDGEEKEFSYKLHIPVDNEKFYEIKKDEAGADNGDITENTTVRVKPKFGSYGIYIILCLAAVGLLVFVRFFTKNMEGEKLRLKRLSQLMRKYGSRMICVEDVPDRQVKSVMHVKSIVDLISLSEELREPIFYSTGEYELPKDGRFYIMSKEYIYILDALKGGL